MSETVPTYCPYCGGSGIVSTGWISGCGYNRQCKDCGSVFHVILEDIVVLPDEEVE